MTTQRTQQIAQTILSQLGGSGRLKAFTGAHTFLSLPETDEQLGGLSFRIKNQASGASNQIKVSLNGKDLYDVEFGRVWGPKYTVKSEHTDVYADQLVSLFEKETGMYLSF